MRDRRLVRSSPHLNCTRNRRQAWRPLHRLYGESDGVLDAIGHSDIADAPLRETMLLEAVPKARRHAPERRARRCPAGPRLRPRMLPPKLRTPGSPAVTRLYGFMHFRQAEAIFYVGLFRRCFRLAGAQTAGRDGALIGTGRVPTLRQAQGEEEFSLGSMPILLNSAARLGSSFWAAARSASRASLSPSLPSTNPRMKSDGAWVGSALRASL